MSDGPPLSCLRVGSRAVYVISEVLANIFETSDQPRLIGKEGVVADVAFEDLCQNFRPQLRMDPHMSSDAVTFDGDYLRKSPHMFLRSLAYKAR